jgi:hypothetical protein
MTYERRDENNIVEVPQPLSNSVTDLGGLSGWAAVPYEDWNGNFSKRNIDNDVVIPGVYSKRDINNQVVIPELYSRRLVDNSPGFSDPLWVAAQQLPAFDIRFEDGSIIDIISGIVPTFTRNSTKLAWDGSQFVEYAVNVPAFQVDPVTEKLGYLHEPAATNMVLRSEEFDNASWNKAGLLPFGSGSTANAIAGPDGTTSADLIVEDTTTAEHFADQNFVAVSGTTYTFSVFAKSFGSKLWIMLRFTTGGWGGAVSNSIRFNLADGTVVVTGGTATGTATNYGNGWWRLTMTATSTANGNPASRVHLLPDAGLPLSYTGNGTSGAYLWGAQLETGTVATSPIITAGSPGPRAADTMTVSGADFSSWYNQLGGAVYWEGATFGPPTSHGLVGFDDTTGAERFQLGHTGTSAAALILVDNNVVQTPSSTTPANQIELGQVSKAAVSIQLNNCQVAANGGSPVTDNSATMPTVTQMTVGTAITVSGMTGPIYRVAYFPPGPAQDRIQQMTT